MIYKKMNKYIYKNHKKSRIDFYSQKRMMHDCMCRCIISDYVPVGDLCNIVHDYLVEMSDAKLNAAIARTKKFEFSNGLGPHLVISYADGQICFARSSNSEHGVKMHCDAHRVAYILQSSDMMGIVCSIMRESKRLKEYLSRLGARLDKILLTCHHESEEQV